MEKRRIKRIVLIFVCIATLGILLWAQAPRYMVAYEVLDVMVVPDEGSIVKCTYKISNRSNNPISAILLIELGKNVVVDRSKLGAIKAFDSMYSEKKHIVLEGNEEYVGVAKFNTASEVSIGFFSGRIRLVSAKKVGT